LGRLGLTRTRAEAAVQVLSQTANACLVNWAGKPQLFLREMAEQWVAALAKRFHASGMSNARAKRLSTLWLQNVSNAPILASDSPAVKAFCREAGIDASELIEAADTIGLNVAILDELMLMRHQQIDGPINRSERAKSKGKAKISNSPAPTLRKK
jgi:hypothetical protein